MSGVFVAGGVNLDLVAQLGALPRAGETVLATALNSFPGGKGANQAAACARLGARTGFLGAVGDDDAGRRLRAALDDAGVDTTGLLTVDAPTGQALICVSASGENTIVVASGANMLVEASHVDDLESLSSFTVFLTQFEAPIPVVQALLRSAPAQAGLKILNCAPAIAEGAPLLPLADILVLNEGELARYADLVEEPQGPADAAAAAQTLLCREGQTVVVTLGGAGAIAVTAAEVIHAPGRPAVVVDTTGAGDCFCGALAASLSRGDLMVDALAFANAAASIAVTRAGAASSMPTLAEVEALLAG